MIRIILGLLIFISILFGYWWLTWIMAILFLFYFPVYYEIIVWGIIYDSLYGLQIPEFWNIKYIFTIFSILIFIFSLFIKRLLIVYES